MVEAVDVLKDGSLSLTMRVPRVAPNLRELDGLLKNVSTGPRCRRFHKGRSVLHDDQPLSSFVRILDGTFQTGGQSAWLFISKGPPNIPADAGSCVSGQIRSPQALLERRKKAKARSVRLKHQRPPTRSRLDKRPDKPKHATRRFRDEKKQFCLEFVENYWCTRSDSNA